MTKFLVSASNVPEIELALGARADIVDVPDRARTTDFLRDIAALISGKSLLCVELPAKAADVGRIIQAAEDATSAGADFLKVKLPSGREAEAAIRAFAGIATQSKLIAALQAGSGQEADLLPILAECGFFGAMLDPVEDGDGGLLQQRSLEYLGGFIKQAKALNLYIGLAGLLEPPDVPRLLPLKPDFLCFRRPAARADALPAAALEQIRNLIPLDGRLDVEIGSDPTGMPLQALEMDKIFVNDFVLPVEIGAYSFEHGKAQKVRFDVTAEIERITEDPRDMSHVLSYDIIMDGIRSIVARGHVMLVETLAEDVARQVLADRRVARVTVRVEKLEIAPARVGIEIVRTRAG